MVIMDHVQDDLKDTDDFPSNPFLIKIYRNLNPYHPFLIKIYPIINPHHPLLFHQSTNIVITAIGFPSKSLQDGQSHYIVTIF